MTRRCAAAALALATVSCQRTTDPRTEDEKAVYAIGAQIYQDQASRLRLDPRETEVLKQGFSDAAMGKTLVVDPKAYQEQMEKRVRRIVAEDVGQERLRGLAFRSRVALEPGATKMDSGLVIRTLKPGSGRTPTAADLVKAHYKGSLVNGTVFDNSYDRGKPLEFSLDGVIPCWTEGLQRMKLGEKAKLVCPSETAYGDKGAPPAIPGGATLLFEIELLEINKR